MATAKLELSRVAIVGLGGTGAYVLDLVTQGRKPAMAKGVKFGRKPKLSDFQRKEALKRRAAGETLTEIAKSYAVDFSTISRL